MCGKERRGRSVRRATEALCSRSDRSLVLDKMARVLSQRVIDLVTLAFCHRVPEEEECVTVSRCTLSDTLGDVLLFGAYRSTIQSRPLPIPLRLSINHRSKPSSMHTTHQNLGGNTCMNDCQLRNVHARQDLFRDESKPRRPAGPSIRGGSCRHPPSRGLRRRAGG